jgi:hypothetical protein
MKKFFGLVIAFTLCVALFMNVGKVSAIGGTIPTPTEPEDWTWVDPSVPATIIPMSGITVAGPAWLQLLSTGLDISGPATICYPFRGAQFGWVGQIRFLYEGTWIPITTTVKWVPTIEAKILACATIRNAGTYALFGYWQPTE